MWTAASVRSALHSTLAYISFYLKQITSVKCTILQMLKFKEQKK